MNKKLLNTLIISGCAAVCLSAGAFAGHLFTKNQYEPVSIENGSSVHASPHNTEVYSVQNSVVTDEALNIEYTTDVSFGEAVSEMADGNVNLDNLFVVADSLVSAVEKIKEIKNIEDKVILTEDEVRTTIEPAAELVAMNFHYTSADTYTKYKDIGGWKVPFTTDETVFTYDGVIKAGIDISKVLIEVDNESKTIIITMPPPCIIAHEIDVNSFKIYDVKKSVFTEIFFDDYTSLFEDLKQKRENAYYDEPENDENVIRNAQVILQGLLGKAGMLEKYNVIFK